LLNNRHPFSLFAWGQQQIASGLASILNATTPLWAVLVAHFLTADEKATPLKVAGVAIGFAGVAVMIGGDFLRDIGGADLTAQLACLVATLSYALAGSRRAVSGGWGLADRGFGRSARRRGAGDAAPGAGLRADLARRRAACRTIAAIARPRASSRPRSPSSSTSGCIESAGATNAILVTFLIPVTAILLGATLLGEVLAPRHFAGMALIAAGLALIDGRSSPVGSANLSLRSLPLGFA
jgi:drug/metabolite transporter (DMT)-like permease